MMRKLLLSLLSLLLVAPAVRGNIPATPSGDSVLVFSDEFNQPGNSMVDTTKWATSQRATATWSRFISDSSAVAFVRDTVLVLRCIRNTASTGNDDAWLSGAKETRNKFSFRYGHLEVRLRTTRRTGNFPAAWLMPQPPTKPWPNGGEIDIFECIDMQERAYHTVHTHWTYDLGNRTAPASSGNEAVSVGEWHVYGFSWTPTKLTWYVDGVERFSYAKSDNDSVLALGQWPFDQPFYIILNQSVGDGSWAQSPVRRFSYETQVDWIRVWQAKEDTGIESVISKRRLFNDRRIYDLEGRFAGIDEDRLPPGIYIRGGQKFVKK